MCSGKERGGDLKQRRRSVSLPRVPGSRQACGSPEAEAGAGRCDPPFGEGGRPGEADRQWALLSARPESEAGLSPQAPCENTGKCPLLQLQNQPNNDHLEKLSGVSGGSNVMSAESKNKAGSLIPPHHTLGKAPRPQRGHVALFLLHPPL